MIILDLWSADLYHIVMLYSLYTHECQPSNCWILYLLMIWDENYAFNLNLHFKLTSTKLGELLLYPWCRRPRLRFLVQLTFSFKALLCPTLIRRSWKMLLVCFIVSVKVCFRCCNFSKGMTRLTLLEQVNVFGAG